jgi:serine/threonine-protein phosphatase 2A activator
MSLTRLEELDPSSPYQFSEPVKKIQDGKDVEFWLHSKAYSDVMAFLLQLNIAMFPTSSDQSAESYQPVGTADEFQTPVLQLHRLINDLTLIIDEAPPISGPRRFGNAAFRKWYELAESKISTLLKKYVLESTLTFAATETSTATSADELKVYLLGSFGSAQRLDFGTGHELSFLAFLACLWKLNAFKGHPSIEKSIVLGVLDPYFHLIRKLIITYNFEPAGSHGVWGLDDHFFLPYIFGSAQLSAALTSSGTVPTEGSINGAPATNSVIHAHIIKEWKDRNLYFGAISFIYDVKKGPFWEHSPMLYDISGVPTGWAKINKVSYTNQSGFYSSGD